MFNSNQLNLLSNKLFETLDLSSYELTKAPVNLQKNQVISLSGRSVTALNSCSKDSDLFVFKDSNSNQYYALGAEVSNSGNILSSRTVLSRHTKPVKKRPAKPPACEILKIAFVYRIINPDKSQQIWLSDFEGETHFIKTVPQAVDYGDLTYTVEHTFPGYTWKRYDIKTEFRRNLDTNVYETTKGELWDMTIADFPPDPSYPDSGVTSPSTSIYTGTYPCDHPFGTPPPEPIVINGSVDVSIADRIIPRYAAGEVGGTLPSGYVGPTRPPTSAFVDAENRTNPDEPNYRPYEIGWDRLPDTTGPYTGFFDGEGNLISALIPYYFDFNDRFYWGVQFTGQTIPNPGGIGTTNTEAGFRFMTGVSSSRYRNFDGTITFSVPPGQFRPYPVNAIAQTEAYLSYSNGRLQTLIRDTGRPSGIGPGVRCQPGIPVNDGGDYFVNFSKHELVGGEIQTSTTLPNWMEYLDNPNRVSDIQRTFPYSDVASQIYYYILGRVDPSRWDNGARDFLASPDAPIPVLAPGENLVYGWEIDLSITLNAFKSVILGNSAQQNFPYDISPIQIDLNRFPTTNAWESGIGQILPVSEKTALSQIVARLKIPVIDDINGDNFDVLSIVPSWSDNTIELCFDTSQITPYSSGGS